MILSTDKKEKQAYSLVEILVSLAVIGIIIVMLFNILLTSLQVTFKLLARTNTREEVAVITNLVARDLRSADVVINCGGTVQSNYNSCTFIIDGDRFVWERCDLANENDNSVCRKKFTDSGQEIIFSSSDQLIVDKFVFEEGFSGELNSTRGNILFTIIGGHSNDFFNVDNLVQQISISTRNYEF